MASGSNDDEGNTEDVCWSLIGSASELSKKRCRLMYSSLGHDSDVCLFFVNGEFFAMDARCAHAGGPLCEGDIEEANGVLKVFCPWHDYEFELRTGKSGTSLQQQVHEVKLEDGNVYVKHTSRLSLLPFSGDQKTDNLKPAASSISRKCLWEVGRRPWK
uniref:Si:ch211-212d10.2 n=2 Tax=Cynoglossus semilaevis TaxID=244447 RepID=A0A3P8UTL5_CYNSE